jgi:hypothetical protein
MFDRQTSELLGYGAGTVRRLALASALLLATVATALASPECKELGTASYRATRTVEINGRMISGTVYISGDQERDETTAPDGKPIVHIKNLQRVITYSPQTKAGILVPVPPGRAPGLAKTDATTQVERKIDGDLQTTSIKKRINDAWVQVYRSVCRRDGVLLERDLPVPLGDKMGTAKMRHTAIEVQAMATETFAVPADVRVITPPPPKAK